MSVDETPSTSELHVAADDAATAAAVRSNSMWVVIALIVVGFVVSLGGVVLTFSVARQAATTTDTAVLGQVAVLAIVGGGGAICVGVGCLLFGWAGGSPYVAVGAPRSIIATTTMAVVLGALLGVGYLKATGHSGRDTGEVLGALGATVYGMFLLMVYVQGVRTGLVTRASLGIAPGLVGRALLGGLIAAVVIV